MAKPDNYEISIAKQTHSKEYHPETCVSSTNRAESSPLPSVLEGLARNKPILDVLSVTCLVLIGASIGVVICLVVLYGKSQPETNTDENFTGDSPDSSFVRIVTRNEWLAQLPSEAVDLIERPVDKVIIAHTATEQCNTQSQCVALVSRIQNVHMNDNNFSDIQYNYLVGADGNVYEGRGWDKQGVHSEGFNKDSVSIAFIGSFTDVEAPEKQLKAARRLIAIGVNQGVVYPNYRLYGQRQLTPTESPGEKVYEQIKAWPHWSTSPK